MQLSDELYASPELMREFQKERLVTEIGELISRIMREEAITRTELADRLGTSRAFVTKLLRTGSNMTARTLADVFFALGYSLRVVERPISVSTPKLSVTEMPSAIAVRLITSVSAATTFATGTSFSIPLATVSGYTAVSHYVATRSDLGVAPTVDVAREAA
jgi:transcriptional regulator with XRE-family HTH domain